MNVKKSLSIFLVVALVCGIVLSFPSLAAGGTPGAKKIISGTARVETEAYMYTLPGTSAAHTYSGQESHKVSNEKIKVDTIVTFDYLENDGDGDTWFHITNVSGTATDGFIYTTYLRIQYEYSYDASFEQQLLYLPTEYHNTLRQLHSKYPNWKFVPKYTNRTLESIVDLEYSSTDYTKTKKYISITNKNPSYFDSRAIVADNIYVQPEQGWTYASRQCIYNFMNPINLLSEERIFCFMNLSKSSETVDGLRTIVNGTFLADGYDDNKDAYINDIIEAANQSGVSSYAIAALIIIEQGTKGDSPIISGTYPDYNGYYNFFNYKAYGQTKNEIYVRGLEWAKSEGWSSRRLAIIGGAKRFGGDYISKGQNSFYLMNFNIDGNATHQYATNVQDAISKAKRLSSAFKENSSASLTFTIPVYTEFYQNPFPDVQPGIWYTEAIKYVKDQGVFSGFDDGLFRPNSSIFRQDFVLALSRCSGENISSYSIEKVNLKDVKSGTYYYDALSWGFANGIIKGYETGSFGVGDNITREQVITVLYRYVKDYLKKGAYIPADASSVTSKYADYNQVSNFAREAVLWALNCGVVSGKSDGKLIAPRELCTRAEIAQILYNCLKNNIITIE